VYPRSHKPTLQTTAKETDKATRNKASSSNQTSTQHSITMSSEITYYKQMSDEKATQTVEEIAEDDEVQEEERLYMPELSRFNSCSLILGLLVGFFIYLSTLGAEFVGVMLWGREILNKSNQELILFSLAWNFITTCIAIVILSSMRRLVTIVFSATISTTGRSSDNVEEILSELLSYMEGRFAVGALVGICFSWNVTNLVLGMKPQIIQSCVILVVACLWCRVTLVLLGSPERTLIHDKKREEEDEPLLSKV
jgi:hypothetical protein